MRLVVAVREFVGRYRYCVRENTTRCKLSNGKVYMIATHYRLHRY